VPEHSRIPILRKSAPGAFRVFSASSCESRFVSLNVMGFAGVLPGAVHRNSILLHTRVSMAAPR